jgi:hypothetical protein
MAAAPGGQAPDEAPNGLHPAFRILLLFVLAAMLFRYSLAALGVALAAILLAARALDSGALPGILRALRRIRWLLLSIVIIYLWIAPEAGAASRPWYAPSTLELDTALRRSGVLVVLVAAVELLRRVTGTSQMAAGLVFLLRPLGRLGIDIEIFARRLALTLEAVPATAERVALAAGRQGGGRGLARIGDAAAELLREIERDAAAVPQSASLPVLSRPAARDWVALAVGIGAIFLVGAL